MFIPLRFFNKKKSCKNKVKTNNYLQFNFKDEDKSVDKKYTINMQF